MSDAAWMVPDRRRADSLSGCRAVEGLTTFRCVARRRSRDVRRDLIDGMSSWAPSEPACRDLLSSSAALVRAGIQTVELEEAPIDDRNGTRSASSADHRRVAGPVNR